MDLHSGAAFWLVPNGLVESPPPLGGRDECDVLIVGARITSALLADALSADGSDVIVLDRREPGLGSTAASTALLLFDTAVELTDVAEKIGGSDAARVYQLGVDAIDTIERLCEELGGCGFVRRPSLYLASRRLHRRRLQGEAKTAGAPSTPLHLPEQVPARDPSSVPGTRSHSLRGSGRGGSTALDSRLTDSRQRSRMPGICPNRTSIVSGSARRHSGGHQSRRRDQGSPRGFRHRLRSSRTVAAREWGHIAAIAARILRELCVGRAHPDARLFRLER